MKKIYLDYAAATPILRSVAAAMKPFQRARFHNPSAVYLQAHEIRLAIDQARADVAAVLAAKAGEIVFCSGTTEANNLAIGGILRLWPKGRIAVAGTEHQAVLAAASGYAPKRVDIIPVQTNGLVTVEALEKAITTDTVLISIGYANSETGVIQLLAKLAQVINQVRAERLSRGDKLPLYLHTDASAAANYLPLKVSRQGVDLMSLGGAKIYGPKSAGLLYVKSGVKLSPLLYGGGQERGVRAGSEDAGSIVGLAIALTTAQTSAQPESKRVAELRDELWFGLHQKLPGAVRHGAGVPSLPNLLSLGLPIKDGERLVMELDEQGLQVATGAACSAMSDQPSHVLRAMGLSSAEANASLRLSLGRYTTLAEVKDAIRLIISAVRA